MHYWLVISVAALQIPVCNNCADSTCIMSEMGGKAGYGRAFHLKIGNPVSSEREGLELPDHIRHRKRQSQHPALRAIETGCGDGHAWNRTVCEQLGHSLARPDKIRVRKMLIPPYMLLECSLEIRQRYGIPVGIPVQKPVCTDGYVGKNKCPERDLRLYCPGRPDPQYIQ